MPDPYVGQFEVLIDGADYSDINYLQKIANAKAGRYRDTEAASIRRNLSDFAVNCKNKADLELYHRVWGYSDHSWIDDLEAIPLRQRARDKIASLNNAHDIKGTIDAMDDAALAALTTYHNAPRGNEDQKRAALQVLNTTLNLVGGVDFGQQANLHDAEANLIDRAVEEKRTSLQNAHDIKGTIDAMDAMDDAALAALTTYHNTPRGNEDQKRAALQVLNTTLNLVGGVDFGQQANLHDAEANLIDRAVEEKRTSLQNAHDIKGTIDAMDAMDDAALAALTTYHNTPRGNEDQKRAALQVLNTTLNLVGGVDFGQQANLHNAEANLINRAVEEKRTSLQNAHDIKATIDAMDDAALAALTTYHNTPRGNEDQKRAALQVLNTTLNLVGGVDFGQQANLHNAEANLIDRAVEEKRTSLQNAHDIKATIDVMGDAALAALTTYHNAPRGNEDQKRAALQVLNTTLNLVGGVDFGQQANLHNAEANLIDRAVEEKRTSLKNAHDIKATIDAMDDAALAALTTYHNTPRGNEDQKRAALQVLNTTLNLVGGVDFGQQANLHNAEANLIDRAVEEKRTSLKNAHDIKATIDVMGDAALAALTTYHNAPRGNEDQKRAALQVLNTTLNLVGGVDFGQQANLHNAEANLIDRAVEEKRTSLKNAHDIKTTIDAMDDAALAALTTYHNTPRGNEDQKRAALQVLNTTLNLVVGVDFGQQANLHNAEANLIDAAVVAKHTSLTNAKTITDAINTNLTMGNDIDANRRTMTILWSIATANSDTDIRTRLHEARSSLGGVNLRAALNTEDLLSNAEVRAIKKRASEKYRFFLISEAIKKIDQPQFLERIAAARDEDQILAEINRQRTSWRFTRDFVRNDLSDGDWLEIKRQAGLKLAAINTKPNMADSFWQTGKDPRLEHFTDKLVRNDGTVSDPTPSNVAPSTGAVGIRTANPIETRYQGVKLQQGDKIESVANFPQKARGQNAAQDTATGKLVQDHTGKVTDVTDAVERGKMTEQEKSQMAIKQAKMLITNLKGTAEQTIFITGDDQHHADRVYAALLLMRNDLKFKIESHVPGCEGPRKRAGFELQSTVDDKFIKDKLRGYNDKALEGFKNEAKDFIANTKKSREQMSLMRGGQAGSSTDALKVDEHLTASGKKI